MSTEPIRRGTSPGHTHAVALYAARRRLAMMKVGALGAGILAFGMLTAGIASQTSASASGGTSGTTQSARQPSTLDDSQPGFVAPDSGSANANPDLGNANPGVVNPAPGIVSGQS